MFSKIKSGWDLMQKGKAVADPALWKSRQITSTMLGGAFIAAVQLAKAFGYEIPLDEDTATVVAAGVIGVVNVVLTLSTSKTVGIGGKAPIEDHSFPSLDSVSETSEE